MIAASEEDSMLSNTATAYLPLQRAALQRTFPPWWQLWPRFSSWPLCGSAGPRHRHLIMRHPMHWQIGPHSGGHAC
jgi:hypothetical protein